MIKEIIAYFSSKSSKEARAFGHLYESIALLEREKRCRLFWLNHRKMCNDFIAEYIGKLTFSESSSVLVLGSGPLHEIPIEVLSKTFTRVDLVDVVHLKSTKKENSQYKNIRFIEFDITELEQDLLKFKKPMNKIPSHYLDQNYDLVISANLLSQLSYHLRSFLESKAKPKLSNEELDTFANQVTFDHFIYLKNFLCPVILITDIETLFINADEKIIDTETPYINFNFPAPEKEWWWNLAPIPEFKKEISLKMKVQAFILNGF